MLNAQNADDYYTEVMELIQWREAVLGVLKTEGGHFAPVVAEAFVRRALHQGMRQSEIARLLDVTPSAISQMLARERG